MAENQGLSLCATIFNLVVMGVMSITALVIAYTEASEYEACMHHYRGIKFSYLTWLKATGFLFIFYLTELGLMIMAIINRSELVGIIQMVLLVLYRLFMVAWIVVGAVLLFKEVQPGCPEDSTQWQFGLALFIVMLLTNSVHFVLKCAGLIIGNM